MQEQNRDDQQRPEDVSFEAENAIPADEGDYDDELDRKPINLDDTMDLTQAIADASRPRRKQSTTPTPEVAAATPGSAINGSGQAETADLPTDPPAADLPSADSSGPALQAGQTAVSTGELEAMRKQVADAEAKANEANDKYLRTLADLQNFRRRNEDDIHRRVREGNEKLIKEVLPVLDDFDLAVAAAKQAQSYEQLIGGTEAILRKFREALTKQGVEPIEAVGTPFDTDRHEAVMLDEDSDLPDETVSAELRKGYTLHGRVIRPSLVKVAKSG